MKSIWKALLIKEMRGVLNCIFVIHDKLATQNRDWKRWMIEQVSDTEFKLRSRGSDMTLLNKDGKWEMYVVNAAVKAYRRGVAIPKCFSDLAEVEAKYKSWRGISALVNEG